MIDKIMKLVDAGFTKDEISKILNVSHETTTPVPIQEIPPIPPNVPHETQTAPNLEEFSKSVSALTEALAKQTNLIQSMNIMNSSMPKEETVDDIMASIINPTKGGK